MLVRMLGAVLNFHFSRANFSSYTVHLLFMNKVTMFLGCFFSPEIKSTMSHYHCGISGIINFNCMINM